MSTTLNALPKQIILASFLLFKSLQNLPKYIKTMSLIFFVDITVYIRQHKQCSGTTRCKA